MDKIKILFITSNLVIGGVEKVCWEIVSHLDKEKYQIDFLVGSDEGTEDYYEAPLKAMGCNIYKGGYILGTKAKLRFLKQERELVKKNHYDAVHSHMDFMNAWTLLVARLAGAKKGISHAHATYPDRGSWSGVRNIKYFLQKLAVSIFADVKIGCGTLAAKEHYFGKSVVLYNGMDENRFLSLNQDEKKDCCFLKIARITQQKNPLFTVDLMHELVQKNPAYTLFWVGDGDMRKAVEEKIRTYGLENNIHLLGATTEIEKYMMQCRYALLPSNWEGLPITLVETQLAHCFTFYADTVSDEADIGYCMQLPLAQGAKKWAEVIDGFVKGQKQCDYVLSEEKCRLFDIKTMAERMEKIYQRKG